MIIPRDSAYASRGVGMLFEAIDSPVLVDVAIDWNSMPVTDVYPARVPDLFAGQTINLIAKYDSPARGTIYVTGRVGSRRVRYPVRLALPEQEAAHAALAPTWARAKIADLSSAMLAARSHRSTRGSSAAITDLAMAYHLVSQYTAFVAVDESRIVGDGRPRRILQPVELPEGVSYAGIFGEPCVGQPVRIGAWGLDVQGTAAGSVRVGAVGAVGRGGAGGDHEGRGGAARERRGGDRRRVARAALAPECRQGDTRDGTRRDGGAQRALTTGIAPSARCGGRGSSERLELLPPHARGVADVRPDEAAHVLLRHGLHRGGRHAPDLILEMVGVAVVPAIDLRARELVRLLGVGLVVEEELGDEDLFRHLELLVHHPAAHQPVGLARA